ncbi:MAG: hypothetical protein AB7S26_10920 [Sandaracinaceae bacterium]
MRSASSRFGCSLGVAFVVLAAGCETSTATSGELRVGRRLQECGILGDGNIGRLPSRLYAPDECYASCLTTADCDSLRAAVCGDTIALPRACDEQCAFRCTDGALVDVDDVCDGVDDCADGSDEAGCPPPDMACRYAPRCDGQAQCEDGRDEEGCPPEVDCELRGGWPVGRYCDGFPQCMDGSDERDCAVLAACTP